MASKAIASAVFINIELHLCKIAGGSAIRLSVAERSHDPGGDSFTMRR
jgi:hypothetical protein